MEVNRTLMRDVINYNVLKRYLFMTEGEIIENTDYDRILKARYNKLSRIKKRFLYLLCRRKYIFFCTFTFSDEYIDKCDRTKKDLIKNAIMDSSDDSYYILNIDYGKNTEREHYHAIIGSNYDISFPLMVNYDCFSYIEPIRCTKDDLVRITKYINKLSNHCVKDTTFNRRIIYNFKGYDEIKDKLTSRYFYVKDKDRVDLT